MIVLCLQRYRKSQQGTYHVCVFACGAYVFAAVMFESCAFRPVCLSPAWVSSHGSQHVSAELQDREPTHNNYRSLHLERLTMPISVV